MARDPAAGGLQAKQQVILAALTAILVAASMVTIVSIVLRPARITISVTEADSHQQYSLRGGSRRGSGVQLTIAIAANNTSRRAAVSYRNIFVDLSNRPGSLRWVRANVSTPMPLRQPTRSVTNVKATASFVLDGGAIVDNTTGFVAYVNTSSGWSVRVAAQARFKVGIAWTRLYDIKVSCAPVFFFTNVSSAADCLASY